MINPIDIEKLDNENDIKDLDPIFVKEVTNGKGDDEDGNNTKIQ